MLLPGFEEKCTALYQEVLNKGVKLEDQTDAGKIVEKGILTRTREYMIEFMRFKADKKAAEAAAKSDAKEELEEQAKDFEDKAQEQQKVVKSLLEQTQQAKPEQKAKLEQEAKEAAKVLEEYRKNMRQLVDQAAAVAKEAKQPSRKRWSPRRRRTRARPSWRSAGARRTTAGSCPGRRWARTRRRSPRSRTWRRRCTASWPRTPTRRTCSTRC